MRASWLTRPFLNWQCDKQKQNIPYVCAFFRRILWCFCSLGMWPKCWWINAKNCVFVYLSNLIIIIKQIFIWLGCIWRRRSQCFCFGWFHFFWIVWHFWWKICCDTCVCVFDVCLMCVWCLLGFSEAQMSDEWVLCLHNISNDCHE